MTCARCGCGVFKAEDQIIMNKVWHKCCFRCTRCNKILDKCSAKLFQGEIFCDCCHTIAVEDFEAITSKPCRVVSSPSCICIKRESQSNCKTNPVYDYKKYICFPPEFNNKSTRNIQSCSCIPDTGNKSFCFAFPIPREVANYYNRSSMRKKQRNSSKKPHSSNDRDICSHKYSDQCLFPKARNLSPTKKRDERRSLRDESPTRCVCCPKCNYRSYRKSRPYCSPCRDCCGRACCDVRNRSKSSRRRNHSPSQKSPCRCCRCPPTDYSPRSDSPERPESPDSSPYSPKPHQTRQNHRSREYPHNRNHLESPQKDCQCYKCKDCYCKERSCPRDKYFCCQCFPEKECCYDRCSRNCRCEKLEKYCICGKMNPCNCKLNEVRTECTSICNRCGFKVYAAEKICVSSGSYHTSCFSCKCCHKYLDVKNVYENEGEIYCKHCYNNLMGNTYYGYA